MKYIKLGKYALAGREYDPSCSLKMESNIDLNELIIDLPNLSFINSNYRSFFNPRSVKLESLDEIQVLIVLRYSKSTKCSVTKFISVC